MSMPKKKSAKTKAIQKTYTPEQVTKFVKNTLALQGDESVLMKKMGEELLPKFKAGEKSDELSKKIGDTALELMRMRESDYHCNLMETFRGQYRSLTKIMTEQTIKEYDCQTEIEKSLASVIVGAYVRYIDNSRRLNNELECENITRNRNVYIANLSKQVDRAQRQYLSAVMTLKQIKAPTIEMNIKAQTAFISQNQQINSQTEINDIK